MTDLEQARFEILDIVCQARDGMWAEALFACVDRAIAAARREGYLAATAQLQQDAHEVGAAEMRERFITALYAKGTRSAVECADFLAALPLTPEEPTSKYRWCNRSDCCLCEMEERLPDECRHYVPEEPT